MKGPSKNQNNNLFYQKKKIIIISRKNEVERAIKTSKQQFILSKKKKIFKANKCRTIHFNNYLFNHSFFFFIDNLEWSLEWLRMAQMEFCIRT